MLTARHRSLLSRGQSSVLLHTASRGCRAAASRTLRATASLHTDSTVAVVGLGSMGHGIVQLAATSGYKVIGVETSDAALEHGIGAITDSLTKLASKGKITEDEKDATLGRITGATSLDAVADADLVIEAIVEDMAVKVPFYEELGRIAKPTAILATNTSSYSSASYTCRGAVAAAVPRSRTAIPPPFPPPSPPSAERQPRTAARGSTLSTAAARIASASSAMRRSRSA